MNFSEQITFFRNLWLQERALWNARIHSNHQAHKGIHATISRHAIPSLISSNNEKLISLQKIYIIPFLESLTNELCDIGNDFTLPHLSLFVQNWEKIIVTACQKEEMKYHVKIYITGIKCAHG